MLVTYEDENIYYAKTFSGDFGFRSSSLRINDICYIMI